MTYVFTFNEINYGRIEVEADHKPDNGEIIEQILEGKADYHNTDFTDFRLIEVDGEAQIGMTENSEVDRAAAWNAYLRYLRGWADSHKEPGYYGSTPACFDEWFGNEYQENKTNTGTDSPGSYTVTITETLQQTVTVTANNQHEAEEIVQNEWNNQDHILDADNFVGVEFEAQEVA